MGSLFNDADRTALLARLERLTPDHRRRWGQMTAAEMLDHCHRQLTIALGQAAAEPVAAPALLRSRLGRWLVIRSPLPWPRGKVAAPPEFIGIDQGDWAGAVSALRAKLEEFAAIAEGHAFGQHPLWPDLTRAEWGELAYRHTDYHFRQFGS